MNIRIIIALTLISPIIAGFILYYEPFGISEMFDNTSKINLLLSITLAEFAGYEGISTFSQYTLEKRRILIEDTRNELEKAYGQVYSELNRRKEPNDIIEIFRTLTKKPLFKDKTYISFQQKMLIDDIFMKYPFLFSTKLLKLWEKEFQSLSPERLDSPKGPIEFFLIPNEFKDALTEEYKQKLEQYNELVGKK